MTAPATAHPFERVRARGVLGYSIVGIALFAGAVLLIAPSDWVEHVLMFTSYIAAGLATAWYLRARGTSWRALATPPHTRLPPGRTAVLTLVLIALSLGTFFLLWVPGSYIIPGYVEAILTLDLGSHVPGAPLLTSMNVVSAVILAPVLEEFVFRGVLLHRWAIKWNVEKSVIVSSIVFGIAHADILGGFLFGVVMCLLYIRTGSLLAPIAVHMLNNALATAGELAMSPVPAMLEASSIAELRAFWWVGPVFTAAALLAGILLFHRWYPRRPWTLPLLRTHETARAQPVMEA